MKVALEKFENYLSGWVPQGIKYVTIEEDEWIHETLNAVADPKYLVGSGSEFITPCQIWMG